MSGLIGEEPDPVIGCVTIGRARKSIPPGFSVFETFFLPVEFKDIKTKAMSLPSTLFLKISVILKALGRLPEASESAGPLTPSGAIKSTKIIFPSEFNNSLARLR